MPISFSMPSMEHWMHPACLFAVAGVLENIPIRARVVDPALYVHISVHNIHQLFRQYKPNQSPITPDALRASRTPAGFHSGELDHVSFTAMRNGQNGFYINLDWKDLERKLATEFSDSKSELFKIRTTFDWHDKLMATGFRNEFDSLFNYTFVSRRPSGRQGYLVHVAHCLISALCDSAIGHPPRVSILFCKAFAQDWRNAPLKSMTTKCFVLLTIGELCA